MISSIDMPSRLPKAIRKSSLFGPNGKPVSYFLYPSPRWNLRQYRPRYWLSADTKTNVSEYDRWELVNYSRQLFAQIGNLSTAINHKNSWAFGDAWEPHYMGKNDKWGQEASEFLRYQFYPFCNLRGPQYDLARSLQLSGQMWDLDGDDLMVLTETENGFPALAFFPSTRIGTQATGTRGSMDRTKGAYGGQSSGFVQGGPFDGARIFDGVIMDRHSRMIAARVCDESGETTDIPAYNCELSYEPDWHDQGRGIPRTATCLLRWMNRQDIDEFLQRGMKRAAAMGLKFKREGGEAGLGNEVITSELDTQVTSGSGQIIESGGSAPRVYYEEIEGGEMYYLDSGANEEIEAIKFDNPHPNSEDFVERIERECLANLGWPYEMINVGKTGRAPTRLVCDLSNQSIWSRQRTGYRRWKRAIGYALAKGMKNGFISRNDDGKDPYQWEPGFPRIVSVDQGNDAAADREAYKLGLTSKAIVLQKLGYHHHDIDVQRDNECRDLIERAAAISRDYPQVKFEQAMELLEQRNPNPQILGGPLPGPGGPQGEPAKRPDEEANVYIDNVRIEKAAAKTRKLVIERDKKTGQIIGAKTIDE